MLLIHRTGAKVVGFLTFSKQLKAVSRLLGELEELSAAGIVGDLNDVVPMMIKAIREKV